MVKKSKNFELWLPMLLWMVVLLGTMVFSFCRRHLLLLDLMTGQMVLVMTTVLIVQSVKRPVGYELLKVLLMLPGGQLLGLFLALLAERLGYLELLSLYTKISLKVILYTVLFLFLTQEILRFILIKGPLVFITKSKGETWAAALGWFIPRKYRHVIGDILEDCAEMRESGYSERRIKFHVVYQWLIAVITLLPTSIIGILKQVITSSK